MIEKVKLFFKDNDVWINTIFIAFISAFVNALYKTKGAQSIIWFYIMTGISTLVLMWILIYNTLRDSKTIISIKVIRNSDEYLHYLKHISHAQYLNTPEKFNAYYKCVWDMSRVFLDCNQLNLRITCGREIVKSPYASDKQKINAYLDLIGWTLILKGHVKKGIKSINQGLELINSHLNGPHNDSYYYYLLLKARALRHKGTTYYTYKTELNQVKDYLITAKELLLEDDVKTYYSQRLNKTPDNKYIKEDYINMLYGLYYNLSLYQFYTEGTVDFSEIDNLDSQEHDFIKSHFVSKKDTLDAQINPAKLTDSLENINKNLNSNIYFDEAIETYISQKIIKLHDEINKKAS